ncbi:MAG TPA: penicillin-binding transpeptidase domain-containing protein, partial [Bryobacteraceae bacterium]|nr:penicillin-binding transpeptidase domain-containing protein [Bryobacteraceae bacterium]
MLRIWTYLLTVALCHSILWAAPASQRKPARKGARKSARSGPWRVPTFADSTAGDNVDGDDLEVRHAAVTALGRLNGSVVVADPETGRILTIVNQRLAYQSGFQPCSTIKLVTAFAALREGIVESSTSLRLSRYVKLDLTGALCHSNNVYFALLGKKLGFERVARYASLFGLGEKAAL